MRVISDQATFRRRRKGRSNRIGNDKRTKVRKPHERIVAWPPLGPVTLCSLREVFDVVTDAIPLFVVTLG